MSWRCVLVVCYLVAGCGPGAGPGIPPRSPAPPPQPCLATEAAPAATVSTPSGVPGEPPSAPPTVASLTLDAESQQAREEALLLLDKGRPVEARQLLVQVLTRYPTSAATEVLLAAAEHAIEVGRRQAEGALVNRAPVAAPAPPFAYHLARRIEGLAESSATRLHKVRETRNSVVDDEAWFADNNLSLPSLEVPQPATPRSDAEPGNVPSHVPGRLGTLRLVSAIQDGPHLLAGYGADYSGSRLLAIFGTSGELLHFLDFASYMRGPRVTPGDEQFVEQPLNWSAYRDGVLYVSHGHRTYAASSGGQNAYITALDPADGSLRWRSQPLVAGAANFVVLDRVIITGYGFTAEPDFLYVLDRADGRVLSRVAVRSAPDFIIEQNGRFHVRTYDHNYVFELR